MRRLRTLAVLPWLDSLALDVRLALRVLRREAGFTTVAVASIALGIGANLSIFSFVNALFLGPVPGVVDTDSLVTIHHRTRAKGSLTNASYPDYEGYRRHSASFSGVIAWTDFSATMRAERSTDRISGELVSDNYFQVLGTRAAVGRLLEPRDSAPGGEPAAVLGHEFWQRRFGGDPGINGRTVQVGSTIATIVGIAPRGFRGLTLDAEPPALWMPVSHVRPGLLTAWGSQNFTLAGRLRSGVTLRQATTETRAVAIRLDVQRAATGVWRDAPEYAQLEPLIAPARQARVSPSERGTLVSLLGVLGAVAVLVLLIACLNVANLIVARAAVRGHEIAVRSALGASWGRVVQQLVIENLALSLLAMAVSIPVTLWASRVLTGFGPSSPLAIVAGAGFDRRVAVVALSLAIVTGVLLSLLPVRTVTRTSVSQALGRRSRGMTARAGVPGALVAGQVALSVVLLVGAGLFIRTLLNAVAVDVTAGPDRLLLARLDTSAARYDEERGRQTYRRILEHVRVLPDVADAAQVFVVPLGGRRGGTNIEWATTGGAQTLQVGFNAVSTRHFQVIGIPIVAGRDFLESDRTGSPPVAVINQVMADRLFTGRNPLGQRLTVKWRPDTVVEVVGIVRDGRFRSYRSSMEPTVYVPLAQRYVSPITLEVRAAGNPLALVPSIRRELASIDPNVALTTAQTARAHFDNELWRERLAATIVSWLGLLALVLMAIGLYGLLAFVVAQRTREIGVRMALGAPRRSVLALVLGGLLGRVLAGAVVGGIAAAWLARYVRAWLFGVTTGDPLVYASVALALVVVATIASLVPVRRAVAVDPATALRAE